MNKQGLDEMQLQRRNKIGNQAFLMLLYLLLIDAGLYGFGFRWVSYPANVMIILTICSAVYVVRLIKGNSYVGPSAGKDKPVLKAVFTVLLSILAAIALIIIFKNVAFPNNSRISDMSAPILFITASVAIIIAVVTGLIKQKQNKDDRE